MPDFGAPVAAGITPPDPNQTLQTLSGLMGFKKAQQNLQLGQQQLQVGQATAQSAQQQMNERQLLQQTMASGKAPDGTPIKDANGEIDPVAFSKFANTSLPLTGQAVTQNIVQTLDNRLKLNDSVRGLGQNYRNDISGIVRSGIGAQDPSSVSAGLDAYAQQNPDAAPSIARAKALIGGVSQNMPMDQRNLAFQKLAMEFQPAASTAAQQQPQMGTTTGPGGGVQAFQTNPLSAVPMGATGPEVAQGIGPSEAAQRVPVFQNGQPGTVPLGSITPGAPGYNAGGQFGTGRYGSQPGANPGFASTGAPMGTNTDVDWMKKDYQGVQADASSAQQRIGLYNNVQQLSKQALTGPQARLSYANSLLALVGQPQATDLNNAEAALNKNAAMIQQAFGGNTDMARSVVQHFTPGTAMPDKVNQEISDYGKAYGQMQQFAQKYLESPSNGSDPATYKTAKANLSLVADPRMWEFQNKSPADRVDMLRTMTPQQRAQFGEIYKRASAIGAFK